MKRSGLGPKPESQSFGSADGHRRSSSPEQTGAGTKGGRDPLPTSPRTGAASEAAASRSGLTAAGHKSAEAMREAHQSWADEQIIVSSCAFCGWTFEGTVLEGREKSLAHRQKKHPEACIRKPRPKGSRISKRKNRTAAEEEQIKVDTAEANRIRAEREQNEMLAKIERGRERDRAALAALDVADESV